MKCPKCGVKVPDESVFCLKCGANLNVAGTTAPDDLDELDEPSLGAALPSIDPDLDEPEAPEEGEGSYEDYSYSYGDGDVVPARIYARMNPDSLVKFRPIDDGPDDEEDDLVDGVRTQFEISREAFDAHSVQFDDADDFEGYEMPRGRGLDEDDELPVPEPEVVSADAIAYLRKPHRGRKLAIAGAIVVVAIAAIVVGVKVAEQLSAPYPIDERQFPDAGVREVMVTLDLDKDGFISRDEASQVTELSFEHAQDVSGMGIFPNLRVLSAKGLQLKTVNVSDVGQLEMLDVADSGLQQLDIKGLSHLATIDAANTSLAALDLSAATALASLDIDQTDVANLDVSACAGLASLVCPQHTVVTGAESTQVREYWLPTDFVVSVPAHYYYDTQGQRVQATYDSLGRLVKAVWSESDDEAFAYSYGYDESGRLVSVAGSQDDDESQLWLMGYDTQGNLTKAIEVNSGETVTYAYDLQGRLASIDGRGASRTFAYDAAGNLVSIGGEGAAQLTYDAEGRLVGYATEGNASSYAFAYDASGAIVKVSMNLERWGSLTETFTYDADGRVQGATRVLDNLDAELAYPWPAISQATYSYDAHGNVVSASATYRSDGIADTATISYYRVFAGPDAKPVGSSPLVNDPLMLFGVEAWYWCPWTIQEEGRNEAQGCREALTMAFTPQSAWTATNIPWPVVPGDDTATNLEQTASGMRYGLDVSQLSTPGYGRNGPDNVTGANTNSIG